jgi:hypothetical protein
MFAVQRVEEKEFPLVTANIQSTWNPQGISTSPSRMWESVIPIIQPHTLYPFL